MSFSLTINGRAHEVDEAKSSMKLLDFLHEVTNLTGTKLCCGIGICRACTVAVQKAGNGFSEPMIACSTPLSLLKGAQITTVEGVADGDRLSAIQQAFLDNFAFQCGYCAPGFVMASEVFLSWLQTANVSENELDGLIENAIGDHICRCTGYIRYYEALKSVATQMLEAKP